MLYYCFDTHYIKIYVTVYCILCINICNTRVFFYLSHQENAEAKRVIQYPRCGYCDLIK